MNVPMTRGDQQITADPRHVPNLQAQGWQIKKEEEDTHETGN